MVVNGEFKICVYAVNADIEGCAYGYDSEAKKPEYVAVDLFRSNMPPSQPVQQEQSQAQSQSSNNENNNANSNTQSQTTQIIICQQEKCEVQ